MAAGIVIALLAVVFLVVAAGVGFQVGAAVVAGGAAGAGLAAYPYVMSLAFPFLIFPFLFVLTIAALARGMGRGSRRWEGLSDRQRMFDEWHRQAHDHGAGKAES
ncbi:MAG TPA: hypothetical protein VFM93_06325 [Candidatus Limnocylindria bacterium]|nr:hypothetical protein [Candidatus Limnocylindria bacterium]